MAHESLYNKVRPRTFSAVVGQDGVVKAVTDAIIENRVPPSILIDGHWGCGKTTLARLIAASINCEFREPGSADPCGGANPDCDTCPGVLEGVGNLAGVQELDAASSRSIDSVRTMIDSMTYQTPARYQVYIIDEAHQLSKDAVTALLKTLEQPPPNVIIIMVTTDPDRMPKPILSRLLRYSLSALTQENLATLVARSAESEGITIDENAIDAIVSKSNNSGRDALNHLERRGEDGDDDAPQVPPAQFLRDITDAIADSAYGEIVVLLHERIEVSDALACLTLMTNHARNSVIARQAPDSLTASDDFRHAAAYTAERLDMRTLHALFQALITASRSSQADVRLALEASLLDVALKREASASRQGAATALSQEDIDDIVSQVKDVVIEALRAHTPVAQEPATQEPVSTPGDSEDPPWETSDQDIVAPAAGAAADDDADAADETDAKTGDGDAAAEEADEPTAITTDAEYDAGVFSEAIKSALSRKGALLFSRSMSIEPGEDADERVVFINCQSDRALSDDDWNAAVDAIHDFGWALEERVLEAAH